jgi:acetylglutamate kinase
MKVVVKFGGAVLEDAGVLDRCARAVSELADLHQVVVVHGGGGALTRTLARLGKVSEFVDGLRVTDAETRDVALMVLAGAVNKAMVAALARVGRPALGMCGGDGLAFRARKKKANGHDLGYVGEISTVEPRWLDAIWQGGAIPVVSSVALGHDGQYYSINADQMAAACAIGWQANALIFITDVAGVKDSDGSVIRWLHANRIADLRRDAVIRGGMLPKLEACQEALDRGVPRVRILPASHVDALPQFYFARIDHGTEVLAA